jgi:ABC-type multidrug transport system permease subunit
MLVDIPYKIGNAIAFNVVLYFLTNLRREPGAFFFFLLISFFTTLVMSMFFRFIGSVSRSLAQAMAPAAIFILAIIIFTGFVIPVRYMLGWCRWINYIDPVAYAFESLMINEFHNRDFACSSFVPRGTGYDGISGVNRICTQIGSVAGSTFINGDAFIGSSYEYYHVHKWRNLGIIIAFVIGFGAFYIIAAETVSEKKSKGEVLVFRRGHIPASIRASTADDEEAVSERRGSVIKQVATQEDVSAMIQRQTSVFSWRDVCYEVKIKGETRRILDHVDG